MKISRMAEESQLHAHIDITSSTTPVSENETRKAKNPLYNLKQQLQIEYYRLNFLKEAKYLKRPPQSLYNSRVSKHQIKAKLGIFT